MIDLSIIIPTLNESEYISKTLKAVLSNRAYKCKPEIIVVDSGSTDNTVVLAKPYVDKLISFEPAFSGKWEALNLGAENSKGRVLLFLDADTVLPENYDLLIEQELNDETMVGGAFEFALDGEEFGLRVVELINRIRYRARNSFYGDQGLFVRADVFIMAGRFPHKRLFETSELCGTLKKYGKLSLIKTPVVTSSRRFVEGGIYKVLLNDIRLWFLNKIKIHTDHKSADVYWEENINRGLNKDIN